MTVRFAAAALLLTATIISPLFAADPKLDFHADENMSAVLSRLTGQSVEIRLKSGEKIGGKIEKVGAHLMHLSQLTGAEFYEAVVSLPDVSVVTVRAKK